MNYDHAAAFIRSLTSAETRRAYRYDLECFLTFLERTADAQGPVEASADTIEDYLRALKRKSLAASTKRRRTAALRQFYDWLRETGAVSLNPVPGTVSFGSDTGGNEPSGRTVDRDALSRLLTEIDRGTAQGQRDYTLILVIVYGALRRTEVASLDVEDIRPLGRHWVLDLPVSTQPLGGYVRIPDAVAEQVQQLADRYGADGGPLWRSFSNRNRGERLTPDALYKIVRRVGQQAGIDALSIDVLRRSGLRLASAGGASLDQLRQHARLQTPASTAKYAVEDGDGRLSSTVSDRIPLTLDPGS